MVPTTNGTHYSQYSTLSVLYTLSTHHLQYATNLSTHHSPYPPLSTPTALDTHHSRYSPLSLRHHSHYPPLSVFCRWLALVPPSSSIYLIWKSSIAIIFRPLLHLRSNFHLWFLGNNLITWQSNCMRIVSKRFRMQPNFSSLTYYTPPSLGTLKNMNDARMRTPV